MLTGDVNIGTAIDNGSFTLYGNAILGNTTTDTVTVKGPIEFKYGINLSGGSATGITKGMIALDNVDNVADINKPISTATQTALDLKADLVSPAFAGNPTAPTQASSDNSTYISTTAFVKTAIADLVSSAPAALDTLNELATALGNDPSFAGTISAALGNRVDITSNQSIAGNKTFTDTTVLSGNCTLGTNASGNTLTVYATPTLSSGLTVTSGSVSFPATSIASTSINNSTLVALTGSQTVDGVKTFSSSPLVPTCDQLDNSTKVASTAYCDTAIASITKSSVGLGNVDNSSTATILNNVQSNNNAFTGTTTFNSSLPTSSLTPSSSTQLVTKTYVDSNLSSYLTTSSASSTYAPLANPALTGNPTSTTQSSGDNSTKIATTAYVKSNLSSYALLVGPTFTSTTTTADLTTTGLHSENRISESIGTGTISSNSVSINYNNGAIHYLTGLSANTNFACVLTNIPTTAYKTFTITLLIDSTSYKSYCNSITVNGTSRTLRFAATSDLSGLTVGAGTVIVQQISVLMTSSTTVPYQVISNVTYFA